MIKVMVVDDHEVVRLGLRSLLRRVDDLEVVGEAGSAKEAIERVEDLVAQGTSPDVVVMDVRMPGETGIEACRAIRSRHPEIKVLMLTSYTDDEAVYASVMAGASGYVLKQVGSDELTRAIRTVYNGGSLLDPSTTEKLLERIRSRSRVDQLPEPLKERERRILNLVARGMTNKEIAEVLYLSEKSVRNSVSTILGKLGLSNRTEAAAFAVRNGLTGDWEEDDALQRSRSGRRHGLR